MKMLFIVILPGVLSLILGTFIIAPFVNDMFITVTDLEPGPDTESKLLDLLVFIQWPVYFICGGLTGLFIRKKYLGNGSDKR